MSFETQALSSSFNDNKLAKKVIKFIDIILTLYSPVPFEIRNEMRILQNTLLYSKEKSLDDYMEQLEDKLNTKEKYNKAQQMSNEGKIGSYGQITAIKSFRNLLNESDKENKINTSNIKLRK